MRRLLALFAKWFTTEHGICLLLILLAGTLAITPMAIDDAAPFAISNALDVPAIEARSIVDPMRSTEYAAAHWARSALYIESIGRGTGALLWDRSEFTGVPFLAEWDTRALSPFSIPIYLFGAKTGLWIAGLLKIFVSGALAFYVARVLGFTHPFALFVATAHALSATLLVSPADPVADVAPWAPMIFLFAERLSLGQLRYWPVAAIVIGLMSLGGSPQALASTFVFFILYFAYRRTSRNWASLPGPALSACVAVVLGLGIAAAQLLPWVEWLRNSRSVWTAADAPGWIATSVPFGPLARVADAAQIRSAAPLHTGYVSLLLAGLWIVVRPHAPQGHRQRIDALLIISVIWLSAAIVVASLQPSFKVLQPILIRALVAPLSFGLALGGAAAAEAWLQLKPAQSLAAIRQYVYVVVTFVALAATAYATAWREIAAIPRAPLEAVTAALIIAIFMFILGVTLVRPWPRLMGYALSAVTAFELLLLFVPLQPRTPWADLTAEAPKEIRNTARERIAFGPGTDAAGHMALQSSLMRGFSPRAPNRMAAFLQRAKADPLLFTRAGVSQFILSIEDLSGPYAGLRPQLRLVNVTAEGAGHFEYVPGAEPTRLIHDLRVVSAFEPAQLDSGLAPLVEAAADPGADEGRLGRPLLAGNGNPQEQRINVFQNNPGVLVLAQTYYPDWSANVDGAPSQVFAVDGAFQGIELASGSREAIFRYAPRMFRWGLIISCCALSLSLLGFAHLVYFRVRNQFFKM